ncbi:ExbD/TolR family protein [Enterovibrio nigricans]|uniref:Biopolymer transport protein ExbD n=1 Tax=Enterovibrio nigricans DSM 22720 TaxID=1121868 RepID=A0A1T4VQ25_9GAMM|nr:biopolymer transporter ExbD [Enterovibrio nigricans]PKF49132.1 biopolymer transporter ExbD [Enterovibrio nigricans]SKA66958.1 biopolymer transport protein ExbD [Enterovibrio nigricans DSM 22720]
MRFQRQQKVREDAQIDLTSMLDIVFIMLIFFIVTSSFVRESGVEVNRPSAAHAAPQKTVSIYVAITATNDIYIDQRKVDKERVEATLERFKSEQPEASLVIQADEHAYNGSVVAVIDAAKSAGIESIALAAEQK